MNVLIIAQLFWPDIGGGSTRAHNAAKALKNQGNNVTVVSAFPHYPKGDIPKKYRGKLVAKEQIDGMTIYRTWVPKLAFSSILKRVIIHLSFCLSSLLVMQKFRDTDIIFASNPSFFVSFPAAVYSFFLKKKYIRNVDDMWPEVWYDLGYVKSRIFRKILDHIAQKSYDNSCAVVPLSEGSVDVLESKYKIKREKITVIEHGVDTEKFRTNENKRDEQHQDGSSGRKKILMYAGALSIGYDFDTILQAAKILEQYPIQFIIRGEGDREDYLKQQVQQQKITNVKIDTKFVEFEKYNEILNSADIFLLPLSPVRGFDYELITKTLDYQMIGRPIFCISKGESKRYVNRTKSGIVTSSRDPKTVSDLILKLVKDEKLAEELGQNGRRYVLENLTIEMIGKRLMKVINSCMEREK